MEDKRVRRVHEFQACAHGRSRKIGEQRRRCVSPAHPTPPGHHPHDALPAEPVFNTHKDFVDLRVSTEEHPEGMQQSRFDDLHVCVDFHQEVMFEAPLVKRSVEALMRIGERMMAEHHCPEFDVLLLFEAG
jgi:hypothetical protein